MTNLGYNLPVDSCELRGMGIQFSKLLADNVSKGKQPKQNSLFTFMSRSKTVTTENPVTPTPPEETAKTVPPGTAVSNAEESESEKTASNRKQSDEKRTNDHALFKLPSLSQIDPTVLDQLPGDLRADIIQEYQRQGITPSGVNSITKTHLEPVAGTSKATAENSSSLPDSQIDPSVFDQLPDDLKNDIIQEYKRKGITLSVAKSTAKNNAEPVAGASKAEGEFASSATKISVNTTLKSENRVSYDGIEEVTDIDASYWSALPDDIRIEIEKDIQQRKSEATSPIKSWKNIFKAQRSPIKTAGKIVSAKGKVEAKRKTKLQEIPKAKFQPTIQVEVVVVQQVIIFFIL